MTKDDEKVSVLLVEDTEDSRFMMRRLLELAGYRVLEARNGEEAVMVTRAQAPDIILMDLSLPVIDGLQASRLIRGLEASRDTPIIVVSAHDMADFQVQTREAGCDRYLTKPIDFAELEQLIGELLQPPRILGTNNLGRFGEV
jgi:two-component system, cell cycle response regulator DivK